ncbi:hypothetical protein HY416_01410 [Candidatus Kaiserbacteria bacterium]|nr:hypothetical protein [Candidatus Kaiserbacteria bacterium]
MGATIREWTQKGKSLLTHLLAGGASDRGLFPALLLVTVGLVSFGLGRLSVETGPADRGGSLLSATAAAEDGTSVATGRSGPAGGVGEADTRESDIRTVGSADETSSSPASEKRYVGSKNGSKYHLPWCSGAARIAEENKIWFSSKEEAEAAGYTPAANCKGI